MSEQPSGRRRRSPSLFGPIVLIALGIFFLLANMGLVGELHWWPAIQLWPLLLIFLGLNVIVRQAPRPYDTFLSGLVALLAIGTFGYILYAGVDSPVLQRLGPAGQGDLQTEQIEFPAGDVETAVISMDVTPPGAHVYALEDSRNLIEGTITYLGDLVFDPSVASGEATVRLGTKNQRGWFFGPGTWGRSDESERWQVGLSPDVPMALALDVSAGTAQLDLGELALNDLDIDVSAGDVEMQLPGGDYDLRFDISAGSMAVTLPDSGRHTMTVDVSAGSLTLVLPPSMEARVEVNRSLGSFDSADSRLKQISGNENGAAVWETAGYEDTRDRIRLVIDISLGSVNLQAP